MTFPRRGLFAAILAPLAAKLSGKSERFIHETRISHIDWATKTVTMENNKIQVPSPMPLVWTQALNGDWWCSINGYICRVLWSGGATYWGGKANGNIDYYEATVYNGKTLREYASTNHTNSLAAAKAFCAEVVLDMAWIAVEEFK